MTFAADEEQRELRQQDSGSLQTRFTMVQYILSYDKNN